MRRRWEGPGGFRAVLVLALPLVLSTSAHTVQLFADRVFLMWSSSEAMSAAMEGGLVHWMIVSLFVGVVGYVNTFVAQYMGAKRPERVGKAIWQGVYVAIAAGTLMLGVIPLAGPLFAWVGHTPELQRQEAIFLQVLCCGDIFLLVGVALSCFFSGRGQTRVVLIASVIGTSVNIILDYGLIFGRWGLPCLGIAGAGLATVMAGFTGLMVYVVIFLRRRYRQEFATLSGWRPDGELLRRLLRFGGPNGMQFMLDMLSFTFFVSLVGRMGAAEFAASSMAFQINLLAFLPMLGFSMAVSTLVGHALGDNQPALARRSVWSAAMLTFSYMTAIALAFILLPGLFISPFSRGANAADMAVIEPIVRHLLGFVGLYCLFDSGNLIFSAAIKGAGDTRFVMSVTVPLGWCVMVIPTGLAVRHGWGLYTAWCFLTAYVCILALIFLGRFLGGKWQSMRVIETMPPALVPVASEAHVIEIESANELDKTTG